MTDTAAATDVSVPDQSEVSEPRRLRHTPALDGVRGLAVLLVITCHSRRVIPELPKWVGHGWIGVDLFFALSGFLITSLLIGERSNTGRVAFGKFYGRRALRLLPALYLYLAVQLIYALVTGLPLLEEFQSIGAAVVYSSNWQGVFRPASVVPSFGPLWSLAIEEQFYFVWPAVFALLFAAGRKWVLRGTLLLIVVVVAWRINLYQAGVGWVETYVRTDARVDSLLIGAVGAMLWARGVLTQRILRVGSIIGAVIVVGCYWYGDLITPFFPRGGFVLLAIGSTSIVVATVDGTRWLTRVFSVAPLRAVGRVSYGAYLWHAGVFHAVARYSAGWSSWVSGSVAYGLTAATVAASWFLVEQPLLRKKQRFAVPASSAESPQHSMPVRALVRPLVLGGLAVAFGIVSVVYFIEPVKPVTAATVGAGWTDNFDRNDDGSLGKGPYGVVWASLSGKWAVRDGAAHGTPASGSTAVAVVKIPRIYRWSSVLDNPERGDGIAFRCRDVDNCFMLRVGSSGSQYELLKRVDGKTTVLSEIDLRPAPGDRVGVGLLDDLISVEINERVQLRLVDATLKGDPHAGLVTDRAESSFGRSLAWWFRPKSSP